MDQQRFFSLDPDPEPRVEVKCWIRICMEITADSTQWKKVLDTKRWFIDNEVGTGTFKYKIGSNIVHMFRVEKGARIIDTKEVNHCVESKSKFAIYCVQA